MSTWYIQPTEDDIEHSFHKYIDKIRTASGKWRYIYDRAKKGVSKAIGLDKRKKLEKAAKNYYVAEGTKKYLQDKRDELNRSTYLPKAVKIQSSDSITATIAANNENLQRYKNKFEKAKEAYKKTLAGSIENVIVEGKNAFNKIVSLFKKTPKATVTNNTKGIKYQYSPNYKKTPKTTTTNKSTTKGTYYNPGSTTKSKSTTTSTTKSTNTTSTSKRKPNVIKTTNTDSRDRNYNKQGNLTAYGQLSGSGWKKKKLKKK